MAGDLRTQSLFEFMKASSRIPPPGLTYAELRAWDRSYFLREAQRLGAIPAPHAQVQARICRELAMTIYGPGKADQ